MPYRIVEFGLLLLGNSEVVIAEAAVARGGGG
jgi:hypothetical protein